MSQRILIVDDHPGIRFALSDYLRLHGYEVDCAADRAEAEAALTARAYALAICDLRLSARGTLDGLEVLRFVRERCPHTRTVLLSGHLLPAIEAEARRLGASLVLDKDVGLHAFMPALFRLLDGAGEGMTAMASGPDSGGDGDPLPLAPTRPSNEQHARRQLAELTQIYAAAPVGLALVDTELRFVRINERLAALNGRPVAEHIGQRICDIFPATKLVAELEALYRRVIASGVPLLDVELRGVTLAQPGVERHWIASCYPLWGEGGAVIGVSAVVEEITARKRAEAALRASEARARALVAHAYDGFTLWNADGTVRYASASSTRMLGYDPDQLVGRNFMEFPHPDDLAHGAEIFREVIEQPSEPVSAVLRLRHADGSWRWVEGTMSNLLDNPDVQAIVVNFRDVTEREEAAAALRIAHEQLRGHAGELAERVRERTAQLEAANQELESFGYSVAHDLRAPIRAIDGFSAALAEEHAGVLDAQGLHYVERVRAGVDRLQRLIDALLGLAQVARGDLQRQPVDLSAMAYAVAAELQRAEPQRRVEFSIADGLEAAGDPRLLHVVLESLLGNAWKYTSKHAAARIEVGCMVGDDAGGRDGTPAGAPVYFVRDDGAGFDMESAAKLFGIFERLHSREEFDGTGIGLATVQRIVRRHGGRIWAEGIVERGATFYFTLG